MQRKNKFFILHSPFSIFNLIIPILQLLPDYPMFDWTVAGLYHF